MDNCKRNLEKLCTLGNILQNSDWGGALDRGSRTEVSLSREHTKRQNG